MNEQDRAILKKQCAACGEPFECFGGGCWCDTVSLTDEMRARLLAKYADCLCPACLLPYDRPNCGELRA